ncbi:hypothetical protein V5O48_018236 [Marasmius crinis-equi]|uniref:PSP1 C-terminal domain-containing protein n=2 Tax=Marasmius crinis-equi TaxID=585013 RepID=A0ABR3ELY6_9AGAR
MATFDQLDKLGVRFPGSSGNTNMNDDRPNRFTTETGPPPLSHRERAASQPPRTSDQTFLSSPIIPSRSPWSNQGRLLSPTTGPGGGSGGNARAIPVPTSNRSASFSSQPRNSTSSSYFASAMRDRSFSSTFEDDEVLVEDFPSDDVDYDIVGRGFSDNSGNGGMGISPSMNRGREFANQWSRSRSQSLATTTARAAPMPIGNSSYSHQAGTGSAYASWNEGLLSGTNSLNIPGTLGGGRWGEIRPPARNPTDISNQSPFVRDVGQILLEESSQFKQLWNQQQGRAERDEILPSAGGVSRLGGAGFTRNVGSGSYLGGNGNGNNMYGAIGGGLGGGYGYGGGGMGSGTSSRRHSVSIVQPRRGIQVGFDAGGQDEFEDEDDSPRGIGSGNLHGIPIGGGGGSTNTTVAAAGGPGGGAGGLMLSDEDLLGGDMGMGMLSLNSRLDAHLQSQREGSSPSQRDSQQHTPQNQAPGTASASSSLPIYAPLSRSPPSANDLVSSYRALTLNIGGDGSSRGHTPSDDRGVSPGQPPQQQQQAPQQQQYYFPSQQPQQQQYTQPQNDGSYAARTRAPSQSGTIGGGGPTSPISPTGSRAPGLGGIVQGMTQQQQQAYFGHPQQQQQQQQQPQQHGHSHQHQGPHAQHTRQPSNPQEAHEQGLGKGLPLSAVPSSWPLFIVEFKAGRTDLFYLTDQIAATITQGQMNGHVGEKAVKVGDLVIVEADRGRDLGRVVNDSITVNEVERWLETREHQQGQFGSQWGEQPMSPTGLPGGGKKEITPKMIIGKAGAQDITQLAVKMQDEAKALQLCQSKVRAKKLPMEVVDAEYQWDRRKLTFYFVADKRIDFRELVRELFRLYKTRIWMASLQSSGGFEQ